MPVPFPVGNTYATARRTVENELRKCVHREPAKLRRALDRCLDDAGEHDNPVHRLACLTFIADRLDGRARQSLDITGDGAQRELSLADVVQAVLAARASSASDAQVLDSAALSSAAPALPGVGPDPAP